VSVSPTLVESDSTEAVLVEGEIAIFYITVVVFAYVRIVLARYP